MDVNCELNHVRQELDNKAKEYAILSSKIAIRRIELNAAGVSSKPKNTPDELLRGMIERCNVLIVEIRDLKKRKRELIAQVPPKPKKPRGERPCNRVYILISNKKKSDGGYNFDQRDPLNCIDRYRVFFWESNFEED